MKSILAQRIHTAPQLPGVYFFLDRNKKILYVGKAANLRSRLQSYFRENAQLEPAKRAMLEKTTGFRVQGTVSDIEALILEAQLIKKYKPRYNVLFRDDKTYLSVGFTDEEFPRVIFVRRNTEGVHDVIGPFTDALALKHTLKLLLHIFPYATHKGFPKHCLWYDLGLCPIPKQRPVNSDQLSALKREYRRNIKNLQAVLEGRKTGLLLTLKKEMETAAKREDFEKAARLRDQISGLESIFRHSTVLENRDRTVDSRWKIVDRRYLTDGLPHTLKTVLPKRWPWRIEGYDISNIQGTSATGSMVVFRGMTPEKNQYRKFRIKTVRGANDVAMLKEVISRRLKHQEWNMPDIMLIDGGKAQVNAALAAFANYRGPTPIVMGLAKKHEEIYLPNKKQPFRLPYNHPLRLLFMAVRDESHRFARAYHHKLRSMEK